LQATMTVTADQCLSPAQPTNRLQHINAKALGTIRNKKLPGRSATT
jgi:hypothetical protein